jgi:hypothetical protein
MSFGKKDGDIANSKKSGFFELKFDLKSLSGLSQLKSQGIFSESKNFIPLACFYDENTVLTKNGELLQTIKFSNFTHDETKEDSFDLRRVIRESLLKNLKSRDFSFWIHTIRREKNIEWSDLKQKDSLEYALHKYWRKECKFDGAFVNEVYLTVLIRGVDYPLFSPKTMFYFFVYINIKYQFIYLKNRYWMLSLNLIK